MPHLHSALHGDSESKDKRKKGERKSMPLLQVTDTQTELGRAREQLSGEEAVGGGHPQRATGLRARHAGPGHGCRCPSALIAPTGGESRAIAAVAVAGGRLLAPPPHHQCCPLGPPLELLNHQQRYVRHCNPASSLTPTGRHTQPTFLCLLLCSSS
ncbi:hypothetical protein PAHAL_9G299200 [Panicum hallii]|uniref:Uncharacterized protein n=1 Tax=Panicum hallii TaxID=206008 RepID=A0A2T8I2Z3_9POAL|nr:hypothetical protein PAHAL_9G299200 [Panicum hallii]